MHGNIIFTCCEKKILKMGEFSLIFFINSFCTHYTHKLGNQKRMRRPGIEPGTIAWKATMLTTTPPTLDNFPSNLRWYSKVLWQVADYSICLSAVYFASYVRKSLLICDLRWPDTLEEWTSNCAWECNILVKS